MDAVTGLMVSGLDSTGAGASKGSKPPDMLKAITKPFTKLIVQIDKKVGVPHYKLRNQVSKEMSTQLFCVE